MNFTRAYKQELWMDKKPIFSIKKYGGPITMFVILLVRSIENMGEMETGQ